MNEKISEKMMDGSLFEKILDKEYFVLFTSFVLFSDLFLLLTNNYGLLNFSPSTGGSMPIGRILISIALFSLLVSVALPALFWWCNNCMWSIVEFLKIERLTKISEKDINWLEKSISGRELMSWAIKNSNPVAMAVAKEVIDELDKIQKNRVNLFSLACFVFANCYIADRGLITVFKNNLPDWIQCYFAIIPIACILVSLYGAFFGPPVRSGHIILPGLDIKG